MAEPDRKSNHAEAVQARLNFLGADGARPVLYASVAGGGPASRQEAAYEPHLVTIADARGAVPPPSLDDEGFCLIQRPSAVGDFFDPDEVVGTYHRETETLIKEATGTSKVIVFDQTLRADDQGIRAERTVREPAWFVHNDYTRRSAPQRLWDLLPAPEAEALLARPYLIINTWRPLTGPVVSTPLALCDGRSVAPEDLVKSERRSKERIGEILLARHNPRHRWLYFPAMTPDEVLLIKTFDSRVPEREPSTIHCAFEDPATPPGALPRQSIETRSFAFY